MGTETVKGRLKSVTGTLVSRVITFKCMPSEYPFVGQVICRVWVRLQCRHKLDGTLTVCSQSIQKSDTSQPQPIVPL